MFLYVKMRNISTIKENIKYENFWSKSMVYQEISAAGTDIWILSYILTAFMSGAAFLHISKIYSSIKKAIPLMHFFLVTWSGLMYVSFLFKTPISDVVWYADWVVSTPLIVGTLSLTAMHDGSVRYDLLGLVMGLQAMVIVAGALAQAAISPLATNVLFWISTGFLLLVFYILMKPIRNIAKQTGDDVRKRYDILLSYITLFFIAYPVIWSFSDVVGIAGGLGAFETSLLFVILPFMCKQVYGFLDLYLLCEKYE